jgi:hypothetical protein
LRPFEALSKVQIAAEHAFQVYERSIDREAISALTVYSEHAVLVKVGRKMQLNSSHDSFVWLEAKLD